MSMSAANIYAKCLLPLKEGYPLYCPELPDRRNVGTYYEAYRSKGIDIGDVGIITPDGDFDFLFNICDGPRPDSEGDSLNATNEPMVLEQNESPIGMPIPPAIPTGFRLIDPGEIKVRRNYINPIMPYRYCGREEQTTFNLEASMDAIVATPVPVGGEVGWTFECSSQQGAVAASPGGATLTEVLEEQRFLRSIESIKGWFKYAAEERHRRFTSLTLVTGVIKCKSWNVAAISNSSRTNRGKVSLSLLPATRGTLSASHSWREYRSNMCNSGPEPSSENENQCLFIRGYRIMKQNSALRLLRKIKATDLQQGNVEYYSLEKPIDTRPFASGSASTATQKPPARASTVIVRDVDLDPANNFNDSLAMDVDENYVVDKLSETDEPYHPSDVINRYILGQNPDAEIAITHDKHWWILMDEDNEQVCLDEHELLERVCETYKVAMKSGVIFLDNNPDNDNFIISNSRVEAGSKQISDHDRLLPDTRHMSSSDETIQYSVNKAAMLSEFYPPTLSQLSFPASAASPYFDKTLVQPRMLTTSLEAINDDFETFNSFKRSDYFTADNIHNSALSGSPFSQSSASCSASESGVFSSIPTATSHLSNTISTGGAPRKDNMGAKPYKCPLPGCDKAFALRSSARRHYKIHGYPPLAVESHKSQSMVSVAFNPSHVTHRDELARAKFPGIKWVAARPDHADEQG